MSKITDKNFYRILDANFNRAKEGLRVCEDISRFILENKKTTKNIKLLRHRLTELLSQLKLLKVIEFRDVKNDLGRCDEFVKVTHKNVGDIYLANSQRVKESVRVLEEFMKLIKPRIASDFKKIRYSLYAIEKDIIKKL